MSLMKARKLKMMKTPTLEQKIIEKFVTRDGPPNWPREMRTVKALVKTFGYEVFFHLVLGYGLRSLSFFNTPRGKKILEDEKKLMKLVEMKKSVSIVEDGATYERQTKKSPSLKSLLNL